MNTTINFQSRKSASYSSDRFIQRDTVAVFNMHHNINDISAPVSGKNWIEPKDGYYKIPVLYCTNRKRTGSTSIAEFYGPAPSYKNEYGIVNVSIPYDHMNSKLERPDWWTNYFGTPYNPQKYVDLMGGHVFTARAFFDTLRSGLATTDSGEAFIFIHGYNTSFADGARRTAQLFYDLHYKGIPILYSWPSMNGTVDYPYDEAQAANSTRELQRFLVDVVSRTHANRISIIAHSMGNRVLVKAQADFPKLYPDVHFRHIIMAAPDVYTDDFKEHDFKDVMSTCNDVTLYTSSKDLALGVSCRFHSNISRLGQAGARLFVQMPMTTVDISTVDCSDPIGHSCYAASKRVINDIRQVLRDEPPSSYRRKLQQLRHQSGAQYWQLPLLKGAE